MGSLIEKAKQINIRQISWGRSFSRYCKSSESKGKRVIKCLIKNTQIHRIGDREPREREPRPNMTISQLGAPTVRCYLRSSVLFLRLQYFYRSFIKLLIEIIRSSTATSSHSNLFVALQLRISDECAHNTRQTVWLCVNIWRQLERHVRMLFTTASSTDRVWMTGQ